MGMSDQDVFEIQKNGVYLILIHSIFFMNCSVYWHLPQLFRMCDYTIKFTKALQGTDIICDNNIVF